MALAKKNKSWFARMSLNIRNRLISGIFVIVPFAVTIAIIRWLFITLAGFLKPTVGNIIRFLSQHQFIRELPPTYVEFAISFATIFSLLFVIYLIGVVAKFVAGRKLLALGEQFVLRIPLVRTIYTATKQVTTALSLQDNPAFKSVVLVEFPRKGAYALGFLTGTLQDSSNTTFCKVFIPTTPNPTTGFFELIAAEEVLQIELTIEEAFKMIISGGLVAPETLKITGRITLPENKSQ